MARYSTLSLLSFVLFIACYGKTCHAQTYQYSQDFNFQHAVLPTPGSNASLGLNFYWSYVHSVFVGNTYSLDPSVPSVFQFTGKSDVDGEYEAIEGVITKLNGTTYDINRVQHWTATLRITGGTGRFLQATGTLNITDGKADYYGTYNSFHVSGTINVPYNIFVGGFFDSASNNVIGYYNDNKWKFSNHSYYAYDAQDDIVKYINGLPSGSIINLVGHSYGGDTVARVASSCNKRINILITVDPVSRFGPDSWIGQLLGLSFAKVKANVTTWVDVDAIGGSVLQPSNVIAGVGGDWGTDPRSYTDIFIPSNFPHAYFWQMFTTNPTQGNSPNNESPVQILLGQ